MALALREASVVADSRAVARRAEGRQVAYLAVADYPVAAGWAVQALTGRVVLVVLAVVMLAVSPGRRRGRPARMAGAGSSSFRR